MRPLHCSLDDNSFGPVGAKHIAAGLTENKGLQSLRSRDRPVIAHCLLSCIMCLLFVHEASAPVDMCLCCVRSLDNNALCGVDKYGRGTYTTEALTKLTDALKVNSTLQSIRCLYLCVRRGVNPL